MLFTLIINRLPIAPFHAVCLKCPQRPGARLGGKRIEGLACVCSVSRLANALCRSAISFCHISLLVGLSTVIVHLGRHTLELRSLVISPPGSQLQNSHTPLMLRLRSQFQQLRSRTRCDVAPRINSKKGKHLLKVHEALEVLLGVDEEFPAQKPVGCMMRISSLREKPNR